MRLQNVRSILAFAHRWVLCTLALWGCAWLAWQGVPAVVALVLAVLVIVSPALLTSPRLRHAAESEVR